MKVKFYPAILAILSLGLLVALFSHIEISWQTESVPEAEPTSTPVAIPTPSRSPQPSPSLSATPTPAPSPSPTPAPSPSPTPQSSLPITSRKGALRVSNQTAHAVRVALLPQPEQASSSAESRQSAYREPVHWDFAPEEGGSRGLRLSLPNGDLLIQEGDILVAFAQDGSRRYWGPYVVGKTALPIWNAETGEWQFVLQP